MGLERLYELMNVEYGKGKLNGCALRVIHKNEIIYDEQLGYGDKENKTLIANDTIYRMFSMTKPVTAVAIMILYERAKLLLTDPVSKYLDGFHNQMVWSEKGLIPVERECTIQDLLNMTSGLLYPDSNTAVGRLMEEVFSKVEEERAAGIEIDTVEFANRMGRCPLEFHPGERWRYGTSADILGAVIQIITGSNFAKFLKDEIFIPLGMVDTDFYVPEEKISRFAQIYEYKIEKGGLVPCLWQHLGLNDYRSIPQFESGGAGLVSTMDDYSKFALMLCNNGKWNGNGILGRKTMEYLRQPQVFGHRATYKDWASLKGYEYGNLMRYLVDQNEGATIVSLGTFGWDGWTGNYFFVDPIENLIMIYMVQNANGTNVELINKLQSVIYSNLE